jgi:hypothetical protein
MVWGLLGIHDTAKQLLYAKQRYHYMVWDVLIGLQLLASGAIKPTAPIHVSNKAHTQQIGNKAGVFYDMKGRRCLTFETFTKMCSKRYIKVILSPIFGVVM